MQKKVTLRIFPSPTPSLVGRNYCRIMAQRGFTGGKDHKDGSRARLQEDGAVHVLEVREAIVGGRVLLTGCAKVMCEVMCGVKADE